MSAPKLYCKYQMYIDIASFLTKDRVFRGTFLYAHVWLKRKKLPKVAVFCLLFSKAHLHALGVSRRDQTNESIQGLPGQPYRLLEGNLRSFCRVCSLPSRHTLQVRPQSHPNAVLTVWVQRSLFCAQNQWKEKGVHFSAYIDFTYSERYTSVRSIFLTI